eukprot:CAMPEP_0170481042 /NCGR_PEP_ID=MMETSP0208-20121228/1637_1 /TAXON_ID=197538 /ORGANISM="Strombidium inclinatum, Strain S3" /LENGTH=85 /DNA_ID=CAMNT_0010753677 /DNA_START=371 /DNA_END=628 /DNA_ORIENTATION=+
MAGPHPLLDVDHVLHFADLSTFGLCVLLDHVLRLVIAFEVGPEMLKESDFLLKILRIVNYGEFFADVLSVTGSPLHVVKMMAVRI